MNKRDMLQTVVGKTVKSLSVERFEASDNCALATVELRFTDGSMFSMQLIPRPSVEAVWFADTNSDEAEPPQAVLVKP